MGKSLHRNPILVLGKRLSDGQQKGNFRMIYQVMIVGPAGRVRYLWRGMEKERGTGYTSPSAA